MSTENADYPDHIAAAHHDSKYQMHTVEDAAREHAALEDQFARRTRSTNIRFLVLFVGMAAIFGLLAYRTEVNADELADQQNATEQAFYEACLVRADRQRTANIGRETMVQLALNGQRAPTDPQGRETFTQQLRDALLLPVEDCGESPN